MRKRKEAIAGYLFAAPWFVGLAIFLVWPLLQALYFSFCDYSILTEPRWIGLANYINLFQDELFYTSLFNTFFIAIFAVPGGTIMALVLAMLLNNNVKGQSFYRTFFFLPSLVPAVPLAILWAWLFNANNGVINELLRLVGIQGPNWLGDPNFSKPVIILMSIWGVGNAMVIYLAGLQEVPRHLYEAADLDGANPWQKTRNVTLPMLSPVILFNVVMGIIGGLQMFTQPFILFPGGAPARSTYLYTVYLYEQAFISLRMGYASAMGWVMFLIILVLTLIALKIGEKRVHYEGG